MEICQKHSAIRCPHCGHEHNLDFEDVPWCEESDVDKECRSCGKKFIIRADVRVYWRTMKDEDDE